MAAAYSYIKLFGAMSYLAFRQRDAAEVSAFVPAAGALGTATLFPLLLYRLYTEQRSVFVTVVALAAIVIVLELLYFERDALEEGFRTVEKRI